MFRPYLRFRQQNVTVFWQRNIQYHTCLFNGRGHLTCCVEIDNGSDSSFVAYCRFSPLHQPFWELTIRNMNLFWVWSPSKITLTLWNNQNNKLVPSGSSTTTPAQIQKRGTKMMMLICRQPWNSLLWLATGGHVTMLEWDLWHWCIALFIRWKTTTQKFTVHMVQTRGRGLPLFAETIA